jgi:hypothetical protein
MQENGRPLRKEAEAREALSLSYRIRGLPEEDADRFVEGSRSIMTSSNTPNGFGCKLVKSQRRLKMDTEWSP